MGLNIIDKKYTNVFYHRPISHIWRRHDDDLASSLKADLVDRELEGIHARPDL